MSQIKKDVNEAINEFYQLKQKYDKTLKILKDKIIKNPALDSKQKREKYLLLKPKCVKCKKPVGTMFSVTKDDLRAVCGATQKPGSGFKPCSLNIKIEKGQSKNLADFVPHLYDEKTKLMDDIIKIKLDLLFNNITESEAVSKFEKVRSIYAVASESYDKYLTMLINVTQLLDKKEEIDVTDLQIYEIKKQMKELLETTNSTKEAVELYINKLLEILKINQDLKYVYSDVETRDSVHYLQQLPYTLENLNVFVGKDEGRDESGGKVINFVV